VAIFSRSETSAGLESIGQAGPDCAGLAIGEAALLDNSAADTHPHDKT
jgi:hypothetical protein